jgi:purine-nucleoside phosphorylase
MVAMTSPNDAFALAAVDAARLTSALGTGHDVAVVLGSGWQRAMDALGATEAEIDTTGLAGFPPPTAPGHDDVIRSIRLGEHRVLMFGGRVHLYEGHHPVGVSHAVRAAVLAGCGTIALTNAAGSLDERLAPGQAVLISDHLNLTGRSPLAGVDPSPSQPARFVDLTDAYSPRLRALAHEVEPGLSEGVYAALPGPHFETPAEIRMLRTLGADLVGMSTALETIAARHLGAEVLAVSLVTNLAAGITASVDHEEVLDRGRQAAPRLGALLRRLIERLPVDR